jgi:hypothetical protein
MRRLSAARRELLRGDSWFAVLIFAVVSVFMFSLVASVWNSITFSGTCQKAGCSLSKLGTLPKAAEAAMTADELDASAGAHEAGTEHVEILPDRLPTAAFGPIGPGALLCFSCPVLGGWSRPTEGQKRSRLYVPDRHQP